MRIINRVREVRQELMRYKDVNAWFQANITKAETPTLKVLFVKIGNELVKRGGEKALEELEVKNV